MATATKTTDSGFGLAVLIAAVLALGLSKKTSAEVPEEEENGGGDGYEFEPDLSMPSALQIEVVGPDQDNYYQITFKTTITNNGLAQGTFQLTWGTNELHMVTSPNDFEIEGSQIVTLAPGESFEWKQTWPDIFDYYKGYFKCWLFGDWSPDAYAIGLFQ